MSNGKAYLQDGDITVGTLNGADENKYFVTFGIGRLVQSVTTTAKTFPIGPTTGSYNPVILQQVSGTASFGARVKIGFDYPTGSGSVVNRQWQIDNTSGSPNTNVTLQWDPADEIGGFNSSDCHISRWSGSGWESYGNAAASCGSACIRTQMGVTLFSPFGVGSGLALPVELVDFQVVERGDNALITWQTASERNNEGFHVEKSIDGKRFDAIGFVAGNGTSLESRDYQFEDDYFNTDAYYRLKQVDFDGGSSYSKIIFLKASNENKPRLYPNPATTELFVEQAVGKQAESIELKLYDGLGRLVYEKQWQDSVDLARIRVPLDGIPAGTYTLSLTQGSATWVERVQVAH